MRIQVAYNEVTPLVKQDFTKLYDSLKRALSAEEMIFANHRAGFGGIVQWDLPDGLPWRPVTQTDSFERNEAMALLERLRTSGSARLGSRTDLIEAVYSVPSADYLYCARDGQGDMKVMLAGWGYRFPRTPAVNPLTWHPDDEQKVIIAFVEEGRAVSPAIELQYASGRKKRIDPTSDGQIDLGSHRPGTRFSFAVPDYGRELTFTTEKGRDRYVFDLTVARPASVPEVPAEVPVPPVPGPFVPPATVSETVKISFIGYDGRPLPRVDVMIGQGGMTLLASSTGDEGSVTVGKSDLPCGTPLEVVLSGTPMPLPRVNIVLDADENEYEIHYHPSKNPFPWSLIAGIFVAAAATAGAIWLLVENM